MSIRYAYSMLMCTVLMLATSTPASARRIRLGFIPGFGGSSSGDDGGLGWSWIIMGGFLVVGLIKGVLKFAQRSGAAVAKAGANVSRLTGSRANSEGGAEWSNRLIEQIEKRGAAMATGGAATATATPMARFAPPEPAATRPRPAAPVQAPRAIASAAPIAGARAAFGRRG